MLRSGDKLLGTAQGTLIAPSLADRLPPRSSDSPRSSSIGSQRLHNVLNDRALSAGGSVLRLLADVGGIL